MDLSQLVVIVAVFAAVVLLANRAERRADLRLSLHIVLLTLNAVFVLTFGILPEKATPLTLALALGLGGGATLLLFGPVRRRIAPLFPARQVQPTGPDAGQLAGFDPDSAVHMTALVLCLYLLGNTVLSYALAGGMSGLADQFQTSTGGGPGALSPTSLLAQMSLFVLFGLIGVGFGTRRSLAATFRRLGLRAPLLGELGAGAGMAFILFWVAVGLANVWQSLAPEDVLREQTRLSGLIAASIDTLTMAFLVASTAAIGEEVAFRGALQPTFGLWPTAFLFMLTHIQYTLTPAAVMILAVALGFGWLRRRFNTTSAIVAHFLYNFILMAFAVYGQYFVDVLEAMR